MLDSAIEDQNVILRPVKINRYHVLRYTIEPSGPSLDRTCTAPLEAGLYGLFRGS